MTKEEEKDHQEARSQFCKTINLYGESLHRDLREQADSLLIAYDNCATENKELRKRYEKLVKLTNENLGTMDYQRFRLKSMGKATNELDSAIKATEQAIKETKE